MHIERDKARFALTGSSARKLRRGASNLLGGRASLYRLYPFLYSELGEKFSLQDALRWGTLPRLNAIQSDSDRILFLQAYAEAYLQEEIVAEQIVRNLPPFRRFLQVAAQSNASVVNYSSIAADVLANPSNIKNYFQILEDTLVGNFLEPFHLSIRKRQRQSPKFYWFDCGVARTLAQRIDGEIRPSTYEYGNLFETFLINQIRTALDYQTRQYQLSYLLTKDGAEIDLIVERSGEPIMLIEFKSGTKVRDVELNVLNTFVKEIKNSRAYCLYTGDVEQRVGSVSILPWRKGMHECGFV